MAVDEALILVAEAVMLAALLLLSARLWAARTDPYPELVAALINASPLDAELLIALPKPVRVEPGRVCYAGTCYAVAAQQASGRSLQYVTVYKRQRVIGG